MPGAVLSVVVVGAGYTGLGTAVGLLEAEVTDFMVLDRARPEPGSWRDDTIALFRLGRHVEFGNDVTRIALDGDDWVLDTEAGQRFTARTVVLATGSVEGSPDIRGIENYTGKIIDAAQVGDGADLAGLRVAVVGNSAAAASVLSTVVRKATSVKLFQSSPDWILPRSNNRFGDLVDRTLRRETRQAWFSGRRPKSLGLLEVVAQRNLRRRVPDPWIRRQLTPLRLTGRPNVVVADEFLTALQAPNCKLVTWPIARFSTGGIRTAEGIDHQCDVVVFASNPDAGSTTAAVPVVGARRRKLKPADRASVTVAGFPNLFIADLPAAEPSRDSARKTQARINTVVGGVSLAIRAVDTAGAAVPSPSRRTRATATLTAIGLRPLLSRARVDKTGRPGVLLARQIVSTIMAVGGSMPRGTEVTRVRDPLRGEWVRAGAALSADDVGPVILYIHGSGYVICSAKTHRSMVARLSEATGLPAFTVDYRLAPEHVFPAAADDVRAAYDWLLERGHAAKDIVIAGDSAGGHLAIDLLIENHRLGVPQPGAVALFSPLLDLTLGLAAEREKVHADPVITAEAAKHLVDKYTRFEPADSPRLRLSLPAGISLPPTLIQAGGVEFLADDAAELAQMIERASGQCDLQIWPGQLHVFQALPRLIPEADPALHEAARYINGVLTQQPLRTARTA
ncbi:alpha/beta hydrolase fold domain-containing protein [Mycobacterium sp. NPDC050853]|uniref:alpha/beta hydrolase fold domain-containing protein n=1 Tax=Mycobacterium sp. NPDC050853 TaxID=3155160 RepID=UPI0033FA8D69